MGRNSLIKRKVFPLQVTKKVKIGTYNDAFYKSFLNFYLQRNLKICANDEDIGKASAQSIVTVVIFFATFIFQETLS